MADEQLWCFTVSLKGTSISFASNSPERREDWINEIEEVIAQRVQLVCFFQFLFNFFFSNLY